MNWQLVWLGIIATTTVVMALVQVVLLARTAALARQAAEAADELRRDVRQLMVKAHRIADDAERATTLALVQIERVDRLMATTTARVDEVMDAVHSAVVEPLRRGPIWLTLVRAAAGLFTGWRARARDAEPEDEDPMFVG